MTATFLTAQDANWDLERGAFNVLVDQQPAGIAVPRSADEVSDVVRSAAADGKRVAAQCTGHNAIPLGSLADTVLLRTAASAAYRSMPMPVLRGSVPEHSGVTWCPGRRNRASPRCMAPPPMSASPATHSVAASASTLASTALPVTG